MPKKSTLAALGYVGLAAADTVLASREGKRARAARFVTKPLLMPTLATAFAEVTQGGGTLAKGTAAAQAFSWGGDVALLGKGDNAFLAGLSSFFAAHVGYVVAFASARDKGNPLANPGVKAAAAMLVTTGPAMAYAAGRKSRRLRLPVAAYSGVLSSMFAASNTLDRRIPARSRRTILAGTGLFLASDTLLGTREFLLKKDSRALDTAVMATYAAGQGLIAWGVAQTAIARSAGR